MKKLNETTPKGPKSISGHRTVPTKGARHIKRASLSSSVPLRGAGDIKGISNMSTNGRARASRISKAQIEMKRKLNRNVDQMQKNFHQMRDELQDRLAQTQKKFRSRASLAKNVQALMNQRSKGSKKGVKKALAKALIRYEMRHLKNKAKKGVQRKLHKETSTAQNILDKGAEFGKAPAQGAKKVQENVGRPLNSVKETLQSGVSAAQGVFGKVSPFGTRKTDEPQDAAPRRRKAAKPEPEEEEQETQEEEQEEPEEQKQEEPEESENEEEEEESQEEDSEDKEKKQPASRQPKAEKHDKSAAGNVFDFLRNSSIINMDLPMKTLFENVGALHADPSSGWGFIADSGHLVLVWKGEKE